MASVSIYLPVLAQESHSLGEVQITANRYEQKQTGKAKAALDLSALHFDEKLLDTQSRSFLQSIRAMQARLNAKPGARP